MRFPYYKQNGGPGLTSGKYFVVGARPTPPADTVDNIYWRHDNHRDYRKNKVYKGSADLELVEHSLKHLTAGSLHQRLAAGAGAVGFTAKVFFDSFKSYPAAAWSVLSGDDSGFRGEEPDFDPSVLN